MTIKIHYQYMPLLCIVKYLYVILFGVEAWAWCISGRSGPELWDQTGCLIQVKATLTSNLYVKQIEES